MFSNLFRLGSDLECSIFSFALDDLMSEIGPRGFHTAFDFHVIKNSKRGCYGSGNSRGNNKLRARSSQNKMKFSEIWNNNFLTRPCPWLWFVLLRQLCDLLKVIDGLWKVFFFLREGFYLYQEKPSVKFRKLISVYCNSAQALSFSPNLIVLSLWLGFFVL